MGAAGLCLIFILIFEPLGELGAELVTKDYLGKTLTRTVHSEYTRLPVSGK